MKYNVRFRFFATQRRNGNQIPQRSSRTLSTSSVSFDCLFSEFHFLFVQAPLFWSLYSYIGKRKTVWENIIISRLYKFLLRCGVWLSRDEPSNCGNDHLCDCSVSCVQQMCPSTPPHQHLKPCSMQYGTGWAKLQCLLGLQAVL